MNQDIDIRLLAIFKEHGLLRGEFTLASGAKTSYYFDGRMVSLWPEGAYLIGKKIFGLLAAENVAAIGGPTIGANQMITAVALVSYLESQPIPAFFIRSEPKLHGTQKQIEGHLRSGSRVALVDDVITTGGSVLRAIEAVESHGCQVVKVVVLLDRHQGGSEELKRRGYDFTAILGADARGEITVESAFDTA